MHVLPEAMVEQFAVVYNQAWTLATGIAAKYRGGPSCAVSDLDISFHLAELPRAGRIRLAL